MDRFIVVAVNYNKFNPETLKSNMDRFIVATSTPDEVVFSSFKIQYG